MRYASQHLRSPKQIKVKKIPTQEQTFCVFPQVDEADRPRRGLLSIQEKVRRRT
jgi:hypothetical protein